MPVTALACLRVCLDANSSWTAQGMETRMVPCCHKFSGACFKPLRFTKSSQKMSKKAKILHFLKSTVTGWTSANIDVLRGSER